MKSLTLLVGYVIVATSAMVSVSSNPAQPLSAANAQSAVPPEFFGMHMHANVTKRQPWPAIPIGAIRLWDTATGWAQINTGPGKYDWSQLDKWLSEAHSHHIREVLYTFGRTPSFASAKPNDSNCDYGAGQCQPPKDLNADGSGSDQLWKNFVTAIASHSRDSAGTHICCWEIWNEPYQERYWSGTFPQLVRMARDARQIIKSIDPNAIILSPTSAMHLPRGRRWMAEYLDNGGGQYADAIAFHGYIHSGRFGDYPRTPDFVNFLGQLRDLLQQHGQAAKPLWDTEAGWGNGPRLGFTDEDWQAGFLVQFYLLHWSEGVPRLYWYAYNDQKAGTLWLVDPQDPSGPGRLTKAGRAYEEMYDWLVGATLTRPCAAHGSVWSCSFRLANGHDAQVIWNATGESTITPGGTFKKIRDLDGDTRSVSPSVKVGAKPMLFESE